MNPLRAGKARAEAGRQRAQAYPWQDSSCANRRRRGDSDSHVLNLSGGNAAMEGPLPERAFVVSGYSIRVLLADARVNRSSLPQDQGARKDGGAPVQGNRLNSLG